MNEYVEIQQPEQITSLPKELGTILYEGARAVYGTNQEGIDTFIKRVFDGKELSLQEMYHRSVALLKSPEYQEKLFQALLSLLPIERTSSGNYTYKRKS